MYVYFDSFYAARERGRRCLCGCTKGPESLGGWVGTVVLWLWGLVMVRRWIFFYVLQSIFTSRIEGIDEKWIEKVRGRMKLCFWTFNDMRGVLWKKKKTKKRKNDKFYTGNVIAYTPWLTNCNYANREDNEMEYCRHYYNYGFVESICKFLIH